MHENEIVVAPELVCSLLVSQFPEYAALPVDPLPPAGTDDRLFRLGDDLVVRMPRIDWSAESAVFEATWLPRLAPYLPLPMTSGGFVRVLRQVPAMEGPVTQEGRGAPLPLLDDWVREWTAKAVDTFGVDGDRVLAVWADALDAPGWDGDAAWLHGDLHEGNLLVRDRRLSAVIDWGAAGRGDPAVELNALWGYLPRGVDQVYYEETGLDEAAWRRARGYALAPNISGAVYYRSTAPQLAEPSLRTVQRLIDSLE